VSNTLTWLHLSDLHMETGDKFNRDEVVLKALLDDLKARIDRDGLRPDFIVFTGDVAFHGKAEEYKLAAGFFDRLLAVTRLSPDRLFVVPGNHDVDWNSIKSTAPGLADCLSGREKVNQFLDPRDVSQRRLLFHPLRSYVRFVGDNFSKYSGGVSDPSFACVRFYEHKLGNGSTKKVALLGLNSAWLSGLSRDARGKVDDYGKLLVGERQVHNAITLAQDAEIRIALVHHPFEWLTEFDRVDVESRLRQSCHFILRGHMHQADFRMEANLDGETIIIPAGAAYHRREYPNGYNIVRLDLDSGKGNIYLRTYFDRRREWIKDIGATGEELDGQLDFTWLKPRSVVHAAGDAPASEQLAKPATSDGSHRRRAAIFRTGELQIPRTRQISSEPSLVDLHSVLVNLASLRDEFGVVLFEYKVARQHETLEEPHRTDIEQVWSNCRGHTYVALKTSITSEIKQYSVLKQDIDLLTQLVAKLDQAFASDNRSQILRLIPDIDMSISEFAANLRQVMMRRTKQAPDLNR
jgi:predicted phosphodiesterase